MKNENENFRCYRNFASSHPAQLAELGDWGLPPPPPTKTLLFVVRMLIFTSYFYLLDLFQSASVIHSTPVSNALVTVSIKHKLNITFLVNTNSLENKRPI